MASNGNSLDQRTFVKLSRLYIIALSTIALSVVISQILIRKHLNDQQDDSSVINVAGRQRMLSQKLTKEILSISIEPNLENRLQLKDNLKQTLLLWELSHNGLLNGNDSLGLPGRNSEEVSKLFKELDPYFMSLRNGAYAIIQKVEHNPSTRDDTFFDNIKEIKENESIFLMKMDQIVNQYDLEANEKVSRLRRLELFLMGLTLLILLLELIFIFWPTAKVVKKNLSELMSAEKKAKKMAYDADLLSAAKEKSIKELRALSQALDETLFFARTTSDGIVLHMGTKFSRRFKLGIFRPKTNISEVLSNKNAEQAIIEDLLSKHKKSGWQGEVKGTTLDNKDIWLEMAIIPFNPLDQHLELLIIASEITKRKKATLEIERLTKSNFEEKMNQQKIISSKIIESQEKEQNRIAKDVHDGIGQMLTGLKYNLESVDVADKEKTASKIEHLKELTSNIIKGVRMATFNLMPPELADHGIVPAITKLTSELAKLTGKHIEFYNTTGFNQRLDSLAEINIYRIVQEAINNAIKYADSTHILVSLSSSESILSIVIDDNGKGFDSSKVKSKKNGDGGMGLSFMKERIKYINGRLFLKSSINGGTRVTLNIPLT